ncbi:unnamed protein product [Protopolystoma xenopodis]|uniref:BTB domain-containing protein n=1 Tax=Protopolystoma xenopodis TaxID=117903 RepID=A0A448X926_9PLAT|nr:unnamed protein product [Protopolystoma xenopodis]
MDRLVAYASSGRLRSLLSANPNNSVIEINDETEENFSALLEFFYSLTLNPNVNLSDYLRIGCRWKVDELLKILAVECSSQFDQDNFVLSEIVQAYKDLPDNSALDLMLGLFRLHPFDANCMFL